MSSDTEVYLLLLGVKASLPQEQQKMVDRFVVEVELISLSDEGKLAVAIVGAKLACE